MVTAPQTVQLTDIVGSLKRHWTLVAAMAVVGLVLGVLVSFLIPASYQATATVSVNAMSASPLTSPVDTQKSVSMPTEAGIAGSRTVAEAAAKKLKGDRIDADKIADSTSVQNPADSLILDISFTGSSAREAAAGANAVAEAYLEARRAEATTRVERLSKTAQDEIAALQAAAADPANQSPMTQRSLQVQADAFGTTLAELGNFDVNPGQVVGAAEKPTSATSPGAVPLGLAGLFLGLLAGVPLALLKKDENSEIGGVDGLQEIGDQIVLDGTKDTNRADTWDIAAFMLKIPAEISMDAPFTIMVDAEEEPGRGITPGQELVDEPGGAAAAQQGVDAGAINEGKISRGWPTDKKRVSWGGEVIIIDTTHLTSDANKVALATRSDSVLLARSTTDDSAALRRLVGLLKSKSVDIALTALFPPRHDMASAGR
jgi:capsular polysaccharide biosynthesis protein